MPSTKTQAVPMTFLVTEIVSFEMTSVVCWITGGHGGDPATLGVVGNFCMVEGALRMVVTSVEEGNMVLEVKGAEIIMDDVKVDIVELQVRVAMTADGVLVIVVERVMS